MATIYYDAQIGDEGDLSNKTIIETIVSCIDSQLVKSGITKYPKNYKGEDKYFGNEPHYCLEKFSADFNVYLSAGGPTVSVIDANKKQMKKVRSKLLKIVGGLRLS